MDLCGCGWTRVRKEEDANGARRTSVSTQTCHKFGTEIDQNGHKIRPPSVWVVSLGAVFYPNGQSWTQTDEMGRRVGVALIGLM